MRDLDWDGYVNARDLGGLPTSLSSTGFTRPGQLARGPRRELMTEAGWAAARRWGLTSVVDLRCSHETGVRPGDPVVPGAILESLELISAPTEDQDDPEFRDVCFPILDSPEYWKHNWRILPQLVRHSLQSIAQASTGVLVHCSAGRDRTGMISALLLGNAGVPADDVAADYAHSVRIMASTAVHTPGADRQASWSPAEVESWLTAVVPIVRHTAQHTGRAFDAIGLADSHRVRLRALLTAD